MLVLAAVACGAAVGSSSSAFSQSSEVPSAAQLVEALKSKARTRGAAAGAPSAEANRAEENAKLIEALKAKAARGLSVTERTQLAEVASTRPSVDLEIFFDLNSSAVSAKAEPVLSSLGRALQDPGLGKATFLVAGYTDAKGRASYNQVLSERRAQAVRQFLAKQFKVPASRLIAVGYGPTRLKNPRNPNADENRRVQVVNLAD